jgi:hypothetical protein
MFFGLNIEEIEQEQTKKIETKTNNSTPKPTEQELNKKSVTKPETAIKKTDTKQTNALTPTTPSSLKRKHEDTNQETPNKKKKKLNHPN